jgi:hypothetical protein
MSRVATGDVVVVKPTHNIYTVLVGIAILVQAIGFLVMYMRANEIFEKGLFQ